MLWTEIIQKVGGVYSRLVWGETSPQFVSMYAPRFGWVNATYDLQYRARA